MDKLKKLEKLQKKLDKMREKHYQNTKHGDYGQSDDKRDWNQRQPIIEQINKIKRELGL